MDRSRLVVLIAAVVTAVVSVAAVASAVTSDDDGVASDAPAVTAAAGAATVAIEIRDFAFGPADVTVDPGTTVTWTNNDSLTHTVVADDGSFQSPDLGNGASFSFTSDEPGTFPYICGIHDSMKGTITVSG